MSRPTEGKVIEPSIPSDLCDVAIEEACAAIQAEFAIPKILAYNIDDYTRYGKEIDHIAWKHGIVAMIDTNYLDAEWAVHNLGEGDKRVTYWNTMP